MLDTIVGKYLDETAPHLRALQEATESGDSTLFNAAFDRLAQTLYNRNKLALEMIDMAGSNWNPHDLAGSYGPAYIQRLPEIDRAIAAKEETLEEMLEGFRTLSPRLGFTRQANRRAARRVDFDRIEKRFRHIAFAVFAGVAEVANNLVDDAPQQFGVTPIPVAHRPGG